jgi:hypothetical protein
MITTSEATVTTKEDEAAEAKAPTADKAATVMATTRVKATMRAIVWIAVAAATPVSKPAVLSKALKAMAAHTPLLMRKMLLTIAAAALTTPVQLAQPKPPLNSKKNLLAINLGCLKAAMTRSWAPWTTSPVVLVLRLMTRPLACLAPHLRATSTIPARAANTRVSNQRRAPALKILGAKEMHLCPVLLPHLAVLPPRARML